jgi:DNA-binding transcriptional LysR family regulator
VSLIADMEDAEGAFVGAKPSGLVRVDIHGTLARHFLLPGLPRFRQPQTPGDLSGHEMVGWVSPDSGDLVPLIFGTGGNARQMKLPAMVTVTGPETNVACASMGLGLIQVPRYRVASELARGALVAIGALS